MYFISYTHTSRNPSLVPHIPAYFWRDGKGWLGPAKILSVTEHNVNLSHNGHQKSPSLNRLRQIFPNAMIDLDSDDDTTALPHSTAAHSALPTFELI